MEEIDSLEVTIEETTIIKGITGGWTKWGGPKHGSYVNQHQRVQNFWICQSCATEQPRELSPYLYEWPFPGEFIRVCPNCFLDDCYYLKSRR